MTSFRLFAKVAVCVSLALAASGFAWAQAPSQASVSACYDHLPVNLAQPSLPSIPSRSVSLTQFGAVGDGVSLCTEAFEKGIANLSKQGGGHLIVPPGVWLTGPIQLKDNIDLHIEAGAIVLLSPDKKDFVTSESSRCRPGISASKRSNIAITGGGVIDGNGKYWRPVKRSKVSDVEWKAFKAMGGTEAEGGKLWFPFNLSHYDNLTSSATDEEKQRADLVRITKCSNVLVSGVTIQNSPRFHLHPVECSDVVIDNVTIRCPWNAQNGDGLDLSSCVRVLISRTTVDVGDDGLCMKSGIGQKGVDAGPCSDILIQDCTVFHAHGGFVLGSDCAGGHHKMVVRRCVFSGTDTGLRFKSAVERGGKTSQIFISDIVMNDIAHEAIVFSCAYEDRKYAVSGSAADKAKQVAPFSPEFADIHISNVVCREAETAISAEGMDDFNAVHDIQISNSTFFFTKKDKAIKPNCQIELSGVRFFTFSK